jgi:hypothetical protein
MIDQELLKMDVRSFCDYYSFRKVVEYNTIEHALKYNLSENSSDYNELFLQEVYKCFTAKLNDQLLTCHGKGCKACDYYVKAISVIRQVQATC